MADKSSFKTAFNDQVARHRDNERERHRMMTRSLEVLQSHVPGAGRRESQVQSLMRVTRYALFLDRLSSRDPSDSLNEEEMEPVYLMAKETVRQDDPPPSFHTVKFLSRQPSTQDSLRSASSKDPIVILIHPTGSPSSGIRILEQRSASADLELLMREEDMKADVDSENMDTSNIDWKRPQRVRRTETVIKHPTGPFPDKCC